MIEVNLLPGGRKRASKGGGFSFKLPALSLGGGAGEGVDRYMAFFAVAAAISIGYVAWSFLGVRGENEELEVRLEQERQDSIRFAALIEQTNELTARRDLLAQRVEIIQQIDAARYTWPHLLDEVASAVPEYLWLTEVVYASESPLTIRIAGRAGSAFAVTNFMRRLEASRFLRGVEMQSMQLQPSEVNQAELVQVFELQAAYESPPLEELETVPLFDNPAAAAQTAVPGGN
ncbi:MAG TPA: PilN domain-containing protein [Longimicrobiales bacterium]|nr:PilN domain-containing protein [Longimicrobiales bacterium]